MPHDTVLPASTGRKPSTRTNVAGPEPLAAPGVLELDRCGSDGVDEVDEAAEVVEARAAGSAEEDGLERILLGSRGAFVEIEGDPPWRAGLVVGVGPGEDDSEAGEVEIVGISLEDLPREREITRLVGRAAAFHAPDGSAGADRLAVARLYVRSGDAPTAERGLTGSSDRMRARGYRDAGRAA